MTPAATSTEGATIRVGNRTIPLAAIARAEPCVERQRDWLSPLTTLMLFMLAAAAIMVGVFTVGWRFYIILGTVLFAAIALVAHALSPANSQVLQGAQVFFVARMVYIPVYYLGLKFVRTAVWTVSMVGLGMMLAAVL